MFTAKKKPSFSSLKTHPRPSGSRRYLRLGFRFRWIIIHPFETMVDVGDFHIGNIEMRCFS